jgi:hypothetical protein
VYLSTRKTHYYIEATVSTVVPTTNFTIVEIGKNIAKPPLGCLLAEGQSVQINIDPYKGTLMTIASEACSRCPLKGSSCRYGIDAFK